jgi:DNA processing protein
MLGITALGPLGPAPNTLTDPPSPLAASKVDAGEREAWAVLASVTRLGPVTLMDLVGHFGSPQRVLDVARRDPTGSGLLDPRHGDAPLVSPAAAAEAADRAGRPEQVLEPMRRLGLRVLLVGDPDYPAPLNAIELPPPVLFVRGDVAALAAARAIAVVGTRHPTEAGRALAMRIGGAIATAGAAVVSGLAIGIDGAAHAAAVHLGRPTVAVLGSGHDRLYPRSHRVLSEGILEAGGAVVSEMAPNEEAARWTFPRRNRVISGLAEATVVVQAPKRSGALNTARWALEQGRGCYVVPGRIGDTKSVGCLELLHESSDARIVPSVEGLLHDLDLRVKPGEEPPNSPSGRTSRKRPLRLDRLGLSSVEARLAELLRTDGHPVDDLVAATGLPVATVLGALTMLETRALVGSAYGRYRPTPALATAIPAGVKRPTATGSPELSP